MRAVGVLVPLAAELGARLDRRLRLALAERLERACDALEAAPWDEQRFEAALAVLEEATVRLEHMVRRPGVRP